MSPDLHVPELVVVLVPTNPEMRWTSDGLLFRY